MYNDKCEPRIGEILCLQRQTENSYDQFAVAVMKNGTVVGHVPRRLALYNILSVSEEKGVCGDHRGKDKSRGWTWC